VLCISATKSLFNYHTYMTKNRWPSIDAHFDVVSIQNLLPSIIEFVIIWTCWLPFWLIETWPFGKAEPSNVVALVALIQLKCIYLATWLILPGILLFINQYSPVTAKYPPIIVLYMKISVKQHQELGENSLTDSVLCFLDPVIPPSVHCIDRVHHLFG